MSRVCERFRLAVEIIVIAIVAEEDLLELGPLVRDRAVVCGLEFSVLAARSSKVQCALGSFVNSVFVERAAATALFPHGAALVAELGFAPASAVSSATELGTEWVVELTSCGSGRNSELPCCRIANMFASLPV